MYENTLQCPDIGTILQHGPEVILADCYPIFNEKLSYSPIIKRKNPLKGRIQLNAKETGQVLEFGEISFVLPKELPEERSHLPIPLTS